MRISIAMKKIKAATPRLSDEELDPIEQDDVDGIPVDVIDPFVPWNAEDMLDIKRLISERMPEKQREIIQAFLEGLNYKDLNMTEKYWRYHFDKGIEFIKKELGL